MHVVDAQVHLWAADSPERPWPEYGRGRQHRPEPMGEAEMIAEMDAAGVDAAVIVPPSWEGDRNDVALAAATAHPERFAVMGRIDVTDESSRGRVETWREQPGMLGIRLTLHRDPHQAMLREGRVDWLWRAAEAAGVPLMIHLPGDLDAVARIASAHPDLRLVLDHTGIARQRNDDVDPIIETVLGLAELPNVAVKASALPCCVDEGYPFPRLQGIVHRLVDAFGPRRVFWGSDITRLPCPYRDCVRLFTEALDVSAEEREWIAGRGLAAWLGWSRYAG